MIKEELAEKRQTDRNGENKLRRIERGEYSPAEFIDELKAMIHQIVLSVPSDNTNRKIIVDSGGMAPVAVTVNRRLRRRRKKPRAPRIKEPLMR